jgi:WhiB family redox-sensing transcriptional regulator
MFEVPPRPEWWDRAVCKASSPSLFFQDEGDASTTNQARRICHTCDARTDCLEYALEFPELHGVWGGLTVQQRRRLRVQRSQTANGSSSTMESAPAPSVVTTRGELTNTEPRMRGLDASADADGTSSHLDGRNKRTAA